jgi:rubrerythrin
MEKRFVSEKNYNGVKNVILIVSIAILSLGLILLITGITIAVKNDVYNSAKRFDGNNMDLQFKSSALMMFGFMLSLLGVVSFVSTKFNRNIIGYHAQTVKPIVEEASDEYSDVIHKNVKNVASAFYEGKEEASKKLYCPNCGKKVESDSNYCPYCGKEIK